jgi:phosphatidylglycerol---prolipoprotein diacylglyceryl transferase
MADITSGKSIMVSMPGGWIDVEIGKKLLHYHHPTGDRFALALPVPLMIGRIGCQNAGCCQGMSQWPAVEVEMAFLALMLFILLLLRARNAWPTQHFPKKQQDHHGMASVPNGTALRMI